MIALLLAGALALSPAQGGTVPPDVRRALEQLRIESIDEVDGLLGREPDAPTARSLAAIGLYLSNTNRLERSLPLFEDVLRTRNELFGPADSATLFAVNQLSRVLLLLGRHDEAIAIVEEHLFEIEGVDGVDPRYLQGVLSNHALNLREAGRIEEALECMRQALELIVGFAGAESPEYARDALNLALILGDLGRWSEALSLARGGLALRLAQTGEDSRETARALRILGSLLRESGERLEAESALRRAERVLRARFPIEAAELGTLMANLGALEVEKGAGAAALDAFQEAHALLVGIHGPEHPRVVEVEVGLGAANLMLLRYDEARRHLEGAVVHLTQRFGASHWATCQARAKLAFVDECEGRLDEAIATVRAVLAEIEAPPPGLVSELHLQLANALIEVGELDAAEEQISAAQVHVEAVYGSDSSRGVEALLHLARVQVLRGELERAEATSARAFEIALAEHGRVLGGELSRSIYSAQLRLLDLARIDARLSLANGRPERALDVMELARRATLELPVAPTAECESLLGAEEEARADLRTLEARDDASVEQLALARNVLAAATAELSRCRRTTRPVTVPAREVRAALDRDEAILAFVWAPEEVAWVVLEPGSDEGAVRSGVCARGESDVAALVDGLARHARALATEPRSRGGPAPELPAALRDLGDAAGLNDARRVWILPDGPLGGLPLERLFAGGARPDIVTLTSLAHVRERGAFAPGGRAVVLGDPAFQRGGIASVRGGASLDRLPAAGAEARYVARLWDDAGGEAELMLGDAATRARLERECAGANLLHLATHGFPGSERAPFDAALALAAAPAEGAGDWVDALTLDRLLRRWAGRLEGCELVVLSACETNREVSVGTGVYSLASGFFRAGAGAVLASLWRVDETATALLMGRFAENLTGARPDLPDGGAPLAPDAALREAQTWLAGASRDDVREAVRRMELDALGEGLRGAPGAAAPALDPAALRPYADPYYWSGFVLLR